jgi:uroporphyrinogen-III decarboxylase
MYESAEGHGDERERKSAEGASSRAAGQNTMGFGFYRYEVKQQYGDRLCFYGGIGIHDLLPSGTPQQVMAEVRRMIEEVGRDGGCILGAGHSIMADVPVENLDALVEAIREQ